jgi:hypothetical protein
VIKSGGLDFKKELKDLSLDQFPIPPEPAKTLGNLRAADAIFAFSFGYRYKTRDVGGEDRRIPGPNNRALAKICADLKVLLQIPLFAQFEIADALDDYTSIRADYITPAADLGTGRVIEAFREQAEEEFQKLHRVVVVAHQHHVARCVLLLLNDFGIDSVGTIETYSEYDPREAQLRVISPEEYILSDFVSMSAHTRWKKLPG